MTTFAISMVRDETDIVEASIRRMATQVDALIVADNLSTDGTTEILYRLADELPLEILHDDEPGFWQSQKMSALATAAYDAGATHIVPFDADEIWSHPDGRIADVLAASDAAVFSAELRNYYCTSLDDPAEMDPFKRMVWREYESPWLPKVAFRYEPGAVIHQGNHGVDLPTRRRVVGGLQVRHFPYRSPDQMLSKAKNGAAAYRATDLPMTEGAHWRSYGAIAENEGDDALRKVWADHFWYRDPASSGLVFDPAPYAPFHPSC